MGTPGGSVVLVSGGLDSAVALHAVLRDAGPVLPLTFDYHLRPRRESEALDALLDRARARAPGLQALRRVALPFLREAGDLRPAPPHLAGAPEGYIPARNLVFYAIAASIAEEVGAARIVGGHNGTDPDLFPDSSPRFFGPFNELLRTAAWSHARSPFRVELPIAGLPKPRVLRLGREMGVPYGLTWSCYADGKVHCGACGSCQERREAFAAAGLEDPVAYGAGP